MRYDSRPDRDCDPADACPHSVAPGGSRSPRRRELLIAAALCSVCATATSDPPTRRVLVLYSNARLAPGIVAVDRGLRDALAASPAAPVQLYSEFLDAPQFEGEAYERTLLAHLRQKYAAQAPEVLVAVSDAAFVFLVRHRRDLFPAAPLVHAGVAPAVLARHGAASDVLGVPMEYDFGGTIAQALRFHPTARRLVVITGAASRDRGWEARLRNEVPGIAGQRTVEFWAGLPTPQLLERLAALDAGSVVFTPGYYLDGAGAASIPPDAVARIAQASPAPVYGPLDTFIGRGVVGGRMPSFEGVGQQAGQIVSALLAGEAPGSNRLPERTPVVLHVDWRAVQRFGIDAAAIPPDAVLHFRAPGFWQQYRAVALGGGAVIALQATLIAALVIERRRRRVAEMAAQQRRLELAHASRLAVAGELTASIAHEINQPLGALQTSADTAELLLQSPSDRRDELRRIVERIRRDCARAADVVRRLRQLLARHETEHAPFELAPALRDAALLLVPEARRRGASLDLQIDAEGSRVRGDRTQIGQVLINLVLNALDAVAEVEPERRRVRIAAEADAGVVRVSVHDRGSGIAAQHLPKVFDSFYSTKPQGMGLGLPIARTIVEAHGGRIVAASSPQAGTTFSFELPLLDETRAAAVTAT